MPLPSPTPPVRADRPRTGPLRRRLGAAALAVVAVLASAGCTADQAATPDRRVELSIFWWGGERRAELTEQALRLYSQRYPWVTFKFTWQGNSGYYDRLANEAAAGNAPDVFQIDDNYLTEYAQREILLDLTDHVLAERIDLRRLPTGLVQYGQVAGRTVAAAAGQNTPGLVYNRSLLDRLDLPAPHIGMTYPQFMQWAERVTERTDGDVAGTMDPSDDYKALWMWLRSQGKELYRGRQVGFTEDDATRWFELWRDARRNGATPSQRVIEAASGDDINSDLVAAGKVAATFAWSNQLPELQKQAKDRLGVVAYPGRPDAQWARASLYWAGFRGTRHADTVVDVIDFLVNDEEANRILGTERGLSANLDVRKAVQETLTDQSMKLTAAFEENMADRFGSAPVPPPKGHATVRTLLGDAAESVRSGAATPRQAAATLIPQANAALTG
ncbi:ABC transporter substrate-binding protein [Plantactinospora sp. CA-290183]|uniref:ABC transporter substrate-binding protein n=1 Tax=Plantactinospora sp. CA-290183 TaxID=3240006 RepID=UPI003D8C7969